MKIITEKTNKSIVLGGGCFWCLEAVYNEIEGLDVVSGYAGGTVQNPTYKEVCRGTTGHAEVVKINYNSVKISLVVILDIFFQMHDPTTLNRQGNDIGTQYRSIILYSSEDERTIIQEAIKNAQRKLSRPIVTEIKKLDVFYEAEEYHQKYYLKNPNQGYCRVMIQPKIAKMKKKILPNLEYQPMN